MIVSGAGIVIPRPSATDADFLSLSDLRNLIGSAKVTQYFDDEADGVVGGADANVLQVLRAAEGVAYSRMLRAYDSKDSIVTLAENDPVFKWHATWVAAELASERRPEYMSEDGWGAFKAQYERAIEYFDHLSKGAQRSIGESSAGTGKNTGGAIQPRENIDNEKPFVIAPSKSNPGGPGGF